MNGFSTRRFTFTAIAATGALAASLSLAGSAVAVAPASATASYNCDAAGSGTITLTAADSGSGKTVRIDSTDIRTQFPLAADTVTTTLKLQKTSGGATSEVQFSGTVHDAATTGDPLSFGPLPLSAGSLAAGDTTDSVALTGTPSASNWSVKFDVTNPAGTFTSYCTATSNQSAAFTW
ncbi:hypothetical protein RI138_22315 [Streptomyces sp. C11-1]|uniref:Uncharacterized protein n=1 Tax=Streptomyces durocortorensis TaxID=2811104 RepID=A0ABY9VZK6_9ACTN|nr:hypothetical protein [Streptomyces durocortorensis]WNF29337.1 hypothetical protein RI138_22315 [Streptomyces durocortorensis]